MSDFATQWTVAHHVPPSMGFSRQEYCSGLPCLRPGDLPHPGIKPSCFVSLALAGGFLTTSTTWEAPISVKKKNSPPHKHMHVHTHSYILIWNIEKWKQLSDLPSCCLVGSKSFQWRVADMFSWACSPATPPESRASVSHADSACASLGMGWHGSNMMSKMDFLHENSIRGSVTALRSSIYWGNCAGGVSCS